MNTDDASRFSNDRLSAATSCATHISIVECASWCWLRIYTWSGVDIEGLDPLKGRLGRLEARLACQRGSAVPEPEPEPLVLEEAQKMTQTIVTR